MYRVNKPMNIAFMDLEKAFDNDNWDKLFSILKAINNDNKAKRIIRKLYLNEKVVVPEKESKSWDEANIFITITHTV